MPSAAAERTQVAANDKNVGMGGKCFVGAREAAEGRRGRVTRVDDVTVCDKKNETTFQDTSNVNSTFKMS